MSYFYTEGTVRWKRIASGDPRNYRPNKGGDAFAHFVDCHPVTGKPFRNSQWWVQETYIGV